MTGAPLSIVSDATTHQGRIRSNNEDSFCARPDVGLWCVADGMGGHDGGEFASAAIVDALTAITLPQRFETACASIAGAIHSANMLIHDKGGEGRHQMGSTVVALFLRDDQVGIFWAGDSRAYRFRGGQLDLLTRDHTQVRAMIDRGFITEADGETHPMAHVLSRAVGVDERLDLEVITDHVMPGDVFMLCSDGLHGTMDRNEIAAFLEIAAGRSGAENAVSEKMVARTLELGAPDNVTVVTIAVREPTLLLMDTPVETVRS